MSTHIVEVNNAPDNKSGLIFREARFDDHRQITELQARYGLETETQQTWVHLWAGNPAYQDCPNWPIGWVFENENKEIVGYLGNLLSLYELDNQPVTVASTRGLVMDVRYRSYSLSLLGHFFSQKRVDLYLDTTVSPDALKPHEIFRALRVPTGVWDQAFFWITDYAGFSASLLERKQVRVAKSLRHPLSAGLFLRDALAGRALKIRRNGVEPCLCTSFDERFEEFWQRQRKACHQRLLANRSHRILDWHFKQPLAEGRAWVLNVCKGGELMAYAIFLRQDNPAFALRRTRLVDFQAVDGSTDLLHPIICRAIERCREENVHMLEVMGFSPEKQRVIDGLLPHRRPLSSWRYFYKTANRELAKRLQDPGVWDPTCFDGDASL